MATLEDIAADGGTGDYPPFVDEEGKSELVSSQHPFWVVDGTPNRSSAYGDQTWYVIRFGAPGKTTKTQTGEEITITAPGWAATSETWTLTFDANDDRVGQMTKIKAALALEDNSFVGPCFLHGIPTKKGHTYKKVRGVRDEHPHEIAAPSNGGSSMSTMTQPARDKAPDEDDGVPFAHDDAFRVTL